MNTFIITLVALYSIVAIIKLALLSAGKYPRTTVVTSSSEVSSLVVYSGIIVWGLYVLIAAW